MIKIFLGLMLAASSALANGEDPLAQYLWSARPVIVFAPSPLDPRFVEQMAYLESRQEELAERDVVVLVDTDPGANSALRQKFHPRDFQLLLVAKDGTIMLRKPFPWDVREITRSIDKWPIREQEIRAATPR